MVLNLDAINNFNKPFQLMFCKEYPPQFEIDNTYKKIQDRVTGIMGPLGKSWMIVEKARPATEEVDVTEQPSFKEVA